MYQMNIDTAVMILGKTSVPVAIEVLHFDAAATYGPVSHGSIKETVTETIKPIEGFLKGKLHSNNQFLGAAARLDYDYDIIDRSDGHTATCSYEEADKVFHKRRNFGAITIEEFIEAIRVVTADVQRPDAVDEIIAISTEEAADETEPVIYEEIHSEEGILLTEVATKEVDDLKAELLRLALKVDEQMKQINEVLDQPLPSQINNIERLVRNRQACGLK